MRRRVLGAAWLILIAAQAAVPQPEAGPPGMGPGRGQRGGPLMGFDQDWMLLCFELKVPLETLGQLRPAFQRAWEDRRELMQGMLAGELDRQQLMEEMAAIQQDLQQAYTAVLTEEQRAALQAARERLRPNAGRTQR